MIYFISLACIVCLVSVVVNVLILWIIIKLYTEIMKILNFNAKKKEDIKP